MKLERIVDLVLLERMESLWLQVCRTRGSGISTVQAEEEEVVVVLPISDDGAESNSP